MEIVTKAGTHFRLTRAGFLYREGQRLGKVLAPSIDDVVASMKGEPRRGNNFRLIRYVVDGSHAGFHTQYISC